MDMNSWTKNLLGFLPTVFQPWEDTAYPKLISWRSTPVAFLSQTISRCAPPHRRTANRDCEAAMRLRFQDCATRFGGLPSAFVVSVLRCRREEAWREVASGMILFKFKIFNDYVILQERVRLVSRLLYIAVLSCAILCSRLNSVSWELSHQNCNESKGIKKPVPFWVLVAKSLSLVFCVTH